MRRFRWWWGALVLTCVAVLAGVFLFFGAASRSGQPLARPGPPGTGPLTVVALGDSTVSGEGAGRYTADTDGRGGDWCHRSAEAFVQEVRIPGVTARVNLACSGAPAGQVALGDVRQWGEPSQAQQLADVVKDHRVAAVVIAVGANDDPQFSAQVTTCFKAWFSLGGPSCNEALQRTWKSKVDAMVPKVVNAVGDVKKVLALAGYVPADYQLVLQSYAAPVGPGIPAALQSLDGCPFRSDDLSWIAGTGITTLSAGLKQAAVQSGARFLDLARAGAGHEACSGGSNPAQEWFTRLTLHLSDLGQTDRAQHALQESFHPNAAGHAAIAGCLTEFLAVRTGNAACLSTPDGRLHAAPEVTAR
ncbi:GDSL-type esterase/lipase family protein [Amycolatopsis sp. PS_44_ISF1]|uniref:GDSL-type esterase/lipase family protein n=1 Tax=Amycolatopsis sp. PS_44_ISF1 TaxID=2974917 RepID=UPI0028E04D36|nr:GDSL-type esterase/lipase family protein [Amycolatopsis sp. PS_44_ISF1]MDT8912722.1 GDSL-type esterase/lipase family protein [Amycolatopsis sp. PS_44_ISF1]